MVRHRTTIAVMVVMVGATLIGVGGAALAQAAAGSGGSTTVDFTQVLIAIISALFSVVGGWATYLINGHLKNQQMATLLSNAVQNGLGYLQQQATKGLNGSNLTVDVRNEALASALDEALKYVKSHAAEAINHFGVNDERIKQKLTAKLGLAEIATNLATAGSSMPILAGPLAPAPDGRIQITPTARAA